VNFEDYVSTKQQQIALNAERKPEASFTSLAYHIDEKWMYEAYRRTRKDGARGVDQKTAGDFQEQLGDNIQNLINGLKSGTYKAPPVRRSTIPKGNGETREIGIPTFTDKVLQRAVSMVIEPIFERDFYDFSYGFRPGKSAHQAIDYLWEQTMSIKECWIIDLDIKNFFDTLNHQHLREFVRQRVSDGVLVKMINKWLKAGVMSGGQRRSFKKGTPQGGVISPLLSNLYLHHVLDDWFVKEVQPRLRGKSFIVRYADDAVLGFASKDDALRVLEVLPKRFGKYDLTLHPTKTKLIHFAPSQDKPGKGTGVFDFLGFTWYWGKSRKGNVTVRKKTARNRLARSCKHMWEWCRINMHKPVRFQAGILAKKLIGHYNYYGVTGNFRSLQMFYCVVLKTWRHWLSRRSRDRNSRITWVKFNELVNRMNLPKPRIYHTAY
jgi:RNA-directed DNA polymerase